MNHVSLSAHTQERWKKGKEKGRREERGERKRSLEESVVKGWEMPIVHGSVHHS